MSLVAGRGPLSKDPAGWFSSPLPDDLVFVEPHPRRVQAIRNGQTVIDTERALMVHRRDHPLSYAFPADEVGDLPSEPEPEAPGYVHVPWDAVDTWLEEGRKLVHYPPNPYHRVDCRPTNRGLRVSRRRHHARRHRRHGDRVRDRAGTSPLRRPVGCPHRPVAANGDQHATATTRATRRTGRRWSATPSSTTWRGATTDPPPECLPIKGYLSFDAARADVLAELPASGQPPDCGCEV